MSWSLYVWKDWSAYLLSWGSGDQTSGVFLWSLIRWLWVVPASVGAAAVAFLGWGAWRAGYDPGWLAHEHGLWATVLQPGQSWALLVVVPWLMALLVCRWPRRVLWRRVPMGLVIVAGTVVLTAVLGTASYVPCRNGLSAIGVAFWVLQLFLGQSAPVYPGTAVCTGLAPPALQLAELAGLGATVLGALTVGSALWRPPVEQLRSLLARNVTVYGTR